MTAFWILVAIVILVIGIALISDALACAKSMEEADERDFNRHVDQALNIVK